MGVLVATVGGFAVGVFLRSVLGAEFTVVAGAVIVACFCGGAFVRTRQARYGLIVLACLATLCGIGRAVLVEGPLPGVFASDVGRRVSYEGVVVADPALSDTSARVTVEVNKGGEEVGVLAVVPLKRYEGVAVGDSVRLTGTLSLPEPFASEGGRTFPYDKYLQVRGVRLLAEYGSIWTVQKAPWYAPMAALARAKHWFLDGLARTLPGRDAALAGGVVIGGKTGLGKELTDAFTRTGLVQIIVLSGYNVMVVAQCVASVLGFFMVRRRWAFGGGALALLLFVGIAGFSGTALRAMGMALIALYARATGKSYAASRALLVIVLLMLVWKPYLLAFDPGFDLSVAATAGLIWLAPLIEKKLTFIKRGKNILATTLAAQLSVLPLLLYDTGNLSLVAIPANLLVAPMVPLAMAFAALAGIGGATLGVLSPVLATLVGVPAHAATAYLIFVATTSASLPWAAYTLPAFPFALVVAAYAALAAVAWRKRASGTDQLTFAKKASTYFDFSAGR